MDSRQQYVFLTSTDSTVEHPTNSATDFTVLLPETLFLEKQWMVCLSEVRFTADIDANLPDFFICSDVCEASIVGGQKVTVLRRIAISQITSGYMSKGMSANIQVTSSHVIHTVFDNPYYIPVKKKHIDCIRIYIRDTDGRTPSVIKGTLSCTLHFKRRPFFE